MIAVQPDTLAGIRNRALLSLGYDFPGAADPELVAIRSDDLKFMPDGALKGMIKKSKPTNMGKVGSYLAPRGAQNWSGSGLD